MAHQLSFGDDATARCKRCGIACTVDALAPGPSAPPYLMGTTGESVRVLAKSRIPDGLCATCAVREWFYLMRYELPGMGMDLHRGRDLERLLDRKKQQTFADVLRVLGAQMTVADVDWPRLVAEWHLPIPSAGKGIDKVLRAMDDSPMHNPDHPFWSEDSSTPGKVVN